MAPSGAHEAAGQDAESAENLGVKLRRAREAQGLSIDAVAAEFRIGAHFLKALEDCRFDALGPPVFAKGYLKQYGTRLGLDVAELVADYERAAGQSNIDIAPPKPIRLQDERQITIWIAAGAALVLVAAILSIWWWLGSRSGSESEPEDIAVDASALAGLLQVRAVPEARTQVPAASELELELEAEPEPPVDPETAPVSEMAIALNALPAARPQLEISFIEDSWTEISDAVGERLYFDLGRAGTRVHVSADTGLNLLFGNAGGVELRIDGKPVTIPVTARRGDLAQFELDAPVD